MNHSEICNARPVDIHVGKRLRKQRTLLGMTQTTLGTAVGLTFQQIQKYERGSNRIGASRLFQLSGILGVEVQYFFDKMPRQVAETGGTRSVLELEHSVYQKDPQDTRETLELVNVYYELPVNVRKTAVELLRNLRDNAK